MSPRVIEPEVLVILKSGQRIRGVVIQDVRNIGMALNVGVCEVFIPAEQIDQVIKCDYVPRGPIPGWVKFVIVVLTFVTLFACFGLVDRLTR